MLGAWNTMLKAKQMCSLPSRYLVVRVGLGQKINFSYTKFHSRCLEHNADSTTGMSRIGSYKQVGDGLAKNKFITKISREVRLYDKKI